MIQKFLYNCGKCGTCTINIKYISDVYCNIFMYTIFPPARNWPLFLFFLAEIKTLAAVAAGKFPRFYHRRPSAMVAEVAESFPTAT